MDGTNHQQLASGPRTASAVELSTTDVASIKSCGEKEIVRQFNNSLYVRGEETSKLVVSKLEYTPLNTHTHEARLLRLHPTDDVTKHVRCNVETYLVTDLPPFIAIKNARGYRKFEEAIEVDGQALLISVALERFLRYLRTRISKPTCIWVRYACVIELDPQEQSTYWTREFSDKMYAMASQTFDMHDVNSCLIDSGYFEKVVDTRYASWKKEWYGTPDQMVLPRVCPVRLGTRPSNEAPTMEYQYMPLDMIANEIRIMCIMPAQDTAAPIVMHVAHCPIKCEVTYIALSYRWGTDLTLEHVVMNGQHKTIRKTLAHAIRALRVTDAIVPMWIDAISINQDDIAERGRQVQRMGQIYDSAMSVFSYTGQPGDDTVPALAFVEQLKKHPVVRTNDLGEFHFGKWQSGEDGIEYGENHIKPQQLVPLCAALYRFLIRQYFRRVWILQEVAWASNPTIIADNTLATSFRDLDMAAYNFQDMLMRDLSLAGRMCAVDDLLKEVDVDMLAYPRKLFYFRYILSRGGDDALPFHTFKKNSPGFLETLVLTRDFECTDPRDHIFALWNLARDKDGLDFKPEYSKSCEEVYAQFSRAWIAQHRTLDMLGAVEGSPQTRDFYKVAPSWCPNWNVPASSSCLIRKDYIPTRFMSALADQDGKLYSADGDIDCSSLSSSFFFFDDRALNCTGLIIDRITSFFEEPPNIPDGTTFPRCDPPSNWQFRCFTSTIESHHQKLGVTAYDDPLRAAWAMFHGDSVVAWPRAAESGYGPGICQPDERYVCLPHLSRHVIRFTDSYDRTEAWGVVKSVLRGRRPFVTENGYMGLAPAFIAEFSNEEKMACQLAVVAGCSVPLVLREREDGTYQLVGTCFVQGWMDGEWIEAMMGADSPREFWEAIGQGARIVIS